MLALFKENSQFWAIIAVVLLAAVGIVALANVRAGRSANLPPVENPVADGRTQNPVDSPPENAPAEEAIVVNITEADLRPVESSLVDGRIQDSLDYPFEDDPDLVGAWRSVDFVNTPGQFKPGRRQWKGDLFLKELAFQPSGQTPDRWRTWTKGLVFHSGDKTASRYVIRELSGATYLFFEWKSGDYTIRQSTPKFYVLRK